jgi:hypothetical protein
MKLKKLMLIKKKVEAGTIITLEPHGARSLS